MKFKTVCLIAGLSAAAHVTAADPGADWPQVGGDMQEQHYSTLRTLDPTNVARLSLAWSFEFDSNRGQEATPVVIDGVMYVSSAWSKVYALDAATGTRLWSYDPQVPLPSGFNACCDVVNRGVAVSQGRVFVGTIDGRLIALDAKSGHVLWKQQTTDPRRSYAITGAPRVLKDKVIIGNGGGEYDVRGYVTAYDARTGKQRWRFYTVPGSPKAPPDRAASDPALARMARPTWFGHWYDYGGGGTVWDSMVFDESINQVYIGVGNGTPWNRRVRSDGKGDNLFVSSIVALDADSGAYRWHYQVSPGDSWDYDACQPLVLSTLELAGGPTPVLMQASKNGFFYVIDRRSGKLISAQNFVPQNWSDGIDLATGRPRLRGDVFYEKSNLMQPGGIGGHSWHPMAFNPGTGLMYIPAQELPQQYRDDPGYKLRHDAWNTAIDMTALVPPDDPAAGRAMAAMVKGELIAWDPIAQKEAWRIPKDHYWNGGVLSTAGNLLFQGGGDATFHAYRADTGAPLWSFKAPSGIVAAPATYAVAGRQFVAVLSGWGGVLLGGAQGPVQHPAPPGRVLVFSLDGKASLPATAAATLPPANPSSDRFSDAQVALGRDRFTSTCAVCHGWGAIGGDILPDLRRVAELTERTAWQAVVSDGVLRSRGMIGFKQWLAADEVEAIRAYVSHQADGLARMDAGN